MYLSICCLDCAINDIWSEDNVIFDQIYDFILFGI